MHRPWIRSDRLVKIFTIVKNRHLHVLFLSSLGRGWGQENTHFSQKHTLVITKRDKRLGSKHRDIICFVLVRLQGHNYENWPKSISRGPESVFFGITSRSLCENITHVSNRGVSSWVYGMTWDLYNIIKGNKKVHGQLSCSLFEV